MERWQRQYDEWVTRTPEDDEKIFCYCEHCDGEIYEGEEYLEVDGANIHEDCFDEHAREALDPRRRVAGEE